MKSFLCGLAILALVFGLTAGVIAQEEKPPPITIWFVNYWDGYINIELSHEGTEPFTLLPQEPLTLSALKAHVQAGTLPPGVVVVTLPEGEYRAKVFFVDSMGRAQQSEGTFFLTRETLAKKPHLNLGNDIMLACFGRPAPESDV